MDLRQFFHGIEPATVQIDIALLIARVSIGVMMIYGHGLPKLKRLRAGEPGPFFSVLGMDQKLSLKLAAFSEIFFSFFLIIGFATRVMAIPLALTMLIAAFHALKSEPYLKKELSLLFLLVYVIIILSGAGRYSVDAMVVGI